jgi:hypothetical protein
MYMQDALAVSQQSSCCPTLPACLLQPIVVVRFCPVLFERDGDKPQEQQGQQQQQQQQQQGEAGEGAGEAAAAAAAPHPFDLPYRMVFAVRCCYPSCPAALPPRLPLSA